MAVTEPLSVEDQLAWEARLRPRAAAAATLSAGLTLAGSLYTGSQLSDAPETPLLNVLPRLEASGPVGATESARTALYEFYDSHIGDLVVSAVLLGLASVMAALLLAFLARVVQSRTSRMSRVMRNIALYGCAGVFAGSVLSAIGTGMWIDDLLATDRTVDGYDGVTRPGVMTIGQVLAQLSGLLIAAAYMVISLHAMRTGLFTRAWGILGMFAGAVTVLPIAAFGALIPPIWLLGTAMILIGRWPGGVPPAWVSGKEEPWPSGAELREERMRMREERLRAKGKLAEPDPEPVEALAAERGGAGPHPSSKKRKRKRRN